MLISVLFPEIKNAFIRLLTLKIENWGRILASNDFAPFSWVNHRGTEAHIYIKGGDMSNGVYCCVTHHPLV